MEQCLFFICLKKNFHLKYFLYAVYCMDSCRILYGSCVEGGRVMILCYTIRGTIFNVTSISFKTLATTVNITGHTLVRLARTKKSKFL